MDPLQYFTLLTLQIDLIIFYNVHSKQWRRWPEAHYNIRNIVLIIFEPL